MNLKLTYFNFPFWRAEASRIALQLAEIPFEDVRPTREEFIKMKQTGELPYDQLPILEVEGKIIAQSVSIARFCGKISGLYPSNDDVDAARVDELMETANQITELFRSSMREKDQTKKLALRKNLAESELPKWLSFLNARLSVESGDFFVAERLTIADLVIWRLCSWLSGGILDGIPAAILNEHRALKRHHEMIDSIPQIREHMKTKYNQ